ncbi:glycine cleavage system protein R [Echinimonas agarilytica]|uniref:Glycine cleavage system transcriptional repressor n=1 Tax=Echinimonas agarilytica TaxID=1215918 RepID=A0AA41W5H8_9GAMM|nr:ACT domain-containing protein [Echinimonas agarilytica]MCM2679399.1 transcriptional regulator [Echinimonas agarilytica]
MSGLFIVSLAGKDRPGLLQHLAHQTHSCDGKWLTSRVSYLEGHLAATIKVEVPLERETAVKDMFSHQEGLVCCFDDISQEATVCPMPLDLSIEANDRPGIVNDITNLLDQNGVRILNMENHRFHVTAVGMNMFSAKLKLSLPDHLSEDSLIEKLAELKGGLRVGRA